MLLAAAVLSAQNIRVISTQTIGRGNLPHISADGMHVDCLPAGEAWANVIGNIYVTNDNCELVLHRGAVCQKLTPDGADAHYIWSSVSPDGTRILYNTQHGTSICDLQGNKLAYLGHVNAPVWYGNDYVVGHLDLSDDIETVSSVILLAKADGSMKQQLSKNNEIAMFPSASPATGRIVYNNLDGDVRMMQLNLTENPIPQQLPVVATAERRMMKAPIQKARKTGFGDIKIYINPGHGGHGSNDRGMTVYPFASGDPNGFWESNSNLDKGLFLDSMLNALGVHTMMSRRTNNDGGGNDADILANWLRNGKITQEQHDYMLANGDDRSLSAIAAEANAYGADFMLSIHSNAGNPSNYILELYSGKELNDTRHYAHTNRNEAESRNVVNVMAPYLYENTNSDWTRQPMIEGDKTFAYRIFGWSNGYGVLRNLQIGGTISEGSMHDYTPETYRLLNMGYKKAEAFHFMQTFLTYYLDYTYPKGGIGGQVRDAYQNMIFPAISYHRGTMDALMPLNGAKVELLQNGTVIATTHTDSLYNGCYYFWELTPGEYTVRASMPNYYTQEHQVTVTAGHIVYQPCLLNLQRQTPPEVIAHMPNPAQITDSVDVSVDIVLDFNWDMLEDSTLAAFSISPVVDGVVAFEDANRRLRFTPSGRFEPGVEYTVTLSTKACHPDTEWPNHLQQPFVLTFRTKNRGSIRFLGSYPQQGATDVPLNPSLITLFDQRLNTSSVRKAFSVTDMNGTPVSMNTRSIACNQAPEPYGYASFELTDALQPNTQYKLTIAGSLTDNIGVKLNDPRVVTFTTGAEVTPDIPMVDPLDTLQFVYDLQQSVSVLNGAALRNTNKKYSGIASNEIRYTFFDSDDCEAVFNMKNMTLIEACSEDRVGLYVFGDFTGNELYAKFETEGDIHYAKVCDIDYGGWKWQELDLSALPAGVRYQLTALRVVRKEGILSGSGSIYLNNLSFWRRPDALNLIEGTDAIRKELQDGQIYIYKNGVRYTVLGIEVE